MTERIELLDRLLSEISKCRICEEHLEPNPVLRLSSTARLLVIGQAPGTRVHATGIPWNDPSGVRLRKWLGITDDVFYDTARVAIMPMGYCYPGKGKSGDLPPRPECREAWHDRALKLMPEVKTTLLIGQYAQRAYLPDAGKLLSDNVRNWQQWFPTYIPLPHPSPRNTLWLKQRPWFEEEVIPTVREFIRQTLLN
ncbi:uracil-DNA glycosylase family protein [Hahella ganghwensis]|uniref:uracil-DNA glycosylase family protein n=1 Tax=Hahella ganghwensis TaxID=286420 RepID=UPI00037A166F|nr:uracil-DNA glycosylase family protein [Hahella ganghwensis]